MTQRNLPQNVIVESGAAAIGDGSKAVGAGGVYIDQNSGVVNNNFMFNGALPLAQLRQLMVELQRPSIEELFEIVRDPARIASSLFQARSDDRLAANHIPHMEDCRVGEWRIGSHHLLLPLVLIGERGQGRTRELAEVAHRLCVESGRSVYVAKATASQRMGPVSGLPQEKKILLLIDDADRFSADYADRLQQLLNQLQQDSTLDIVVLLTCRDATHLSHWKPLHLPSFSEQGLRKFLKTIAQLVNLPLASPIAELIAKSDGSPKTVVENVRHALRTGAALSLEGWEVSWQKLLNDRFNHVYRRSQGEIATLFQWIRLLQQVGLPSRRAYLLALTSDVCVVTLNLAVDQQVLLVDQNDVFQPYDSAQIVGSLEAIGLSEFSAETHLKRLFNQLIPLINKNQAWSADLLPFAQWLSEQYEHTMGLSALAIYLQRHRDDADAYKLDATLAWESGNYTRAETSATRLITLQASVHAHLLRSVVYLSSRQPAKALLDLTMAIEMGESHAYNLRAFAHLLNGDFDSAEADLGTVIANDPDDVEARRTRATLRYTHRDVAGALEDFAAAQSADAEPTVAESLVLGALHFGQQEYAAALSVLDAGLMIQPDDAQLLMLKGYSHLQMEDFEQAIEGLSEALRVWETDPLVDVLIQINTVRHDAEQIHQWLRENWRTHMGVFPWLDIELNSAERGLEDILLATLGKWFADAMPQNFEPAAMLAAVYYGRGTAYAFASQYKEAERDFTQAIAHDFPNPMVFLMRGLARHSLKDSEGAYVDCQLAVEHGVQHPWLSFLRGVSYLKLGQPDQAMEQLNAAGAAGRVWAELFHQRALAFGLLGRLVEAEEDADKAISLKGDSAEYYLRRGAIRTDRGNFEGAVEDATQAEKFGSIAPTVYALRGDANVILGRYATAVADFTVLIEQQFAVGNLYGVRCRCYLLLNQLDKARADLALALATQPEDILTLECLGDVALISADYVTALTMYQSALNQNILARIRFKAVLGMIAIGRVASGRQLLDLALSEALPDEVDAFADEMAIWQVRLSDEAFSSIWNTIQLAI